MSGEEVYYLGTQADAEAVAAAWNVLCGLPAKGTLKYFARHGTQPASYSSGALGWTEGYAAELLDTDGPVYRVWLTLEDALLGYDPELLEPLTALQQTTIANALLRIFPEPAGVTLVRSARNPLITMADLPPGYQQNISFMHVQRIPPWMKKGTLAPYDYVCWFSAHTFSYILVAGAVGSPENFGEDGTVHATDITVARLEAIGGFGPGTSPHIGSPGSLFQDDGAETMALLYHGQAGGAFGHASGVVYTDSTKANPGIEWDFETSIPVGVAYTPRYMRATTLNLPGHFNDGDLIAVEEEVKLALSPTGNGLDWTFMDDARFFNRRLVNPLDGQNQPRHGGFRIRTTAGRTLMDVFETRRGDTPEDLGVSTADLGIPNMQYWELSERRSVLRPEFDYEGGLLPVETSAGGRADGLHHQIREACYLDDRPYGGEEWVFYCGGGEFNICAAMIVNNF